MKPVTIAVSCKYPGFARDLARGLAGQGKHFLIAVLDPETAVEALNDTETTWEVLVTDLELNVAENADFRPIRVILKVEAGCRISLLTREITEKVCRQRGESWTESDNGECHLLGFFSCFGGCGTTSAAVTAGRMLAGAYGCRVLYLPLTVRDGSLLYRKKEENCSGADIPLTDIQTVRSAGELVYRLKHDRPLCLENFVLSDEYGLDYLHVGVGENLLAGLDEDELNQFIKGLLRCSSYEWILADLGCGRTPDLFSLQVEVASRQDRRYDDVSGLQDGASAFSAISETPGKIRLWNHGMENSRELRDGGGLAEVIHDEESFLPAGPGQVEIVMSKSYAAGIKYFAEGLMEMVSKRVEWW